VCRILKITESISSICVRSAMYSADAMKVWNIPDILADCNSLRTRNLTGNLKNPADSALLGAAGDARLFPVPAKQFFWHMGDFARRKIDVEAAMSDSRPIPLNVKTESRSSPVDG
jgi:hypothetical protein